jgi:hypothetical protein
VGIKSAPASACGLKSAGFCRGPYLLPERLTVYGDCDCLETVLPEVPKDVPQLRYEVCGFSTAELQEGGLGGRGATA